MNLSYIGKGQFIFILYQSSFYNMVGAKHNGATTFFEPVHNLVNKRAWTGQ